MMRKVEMTWPNGKVTTLQTCNARDAARRVKVARKAGAQVKVLRERTPEPGYAEIRWVRA